MQQSNREKLESLRHVLSRQEGSADEVNEILRIVREEWSAHYDLKTSCDPCKLELVKYAFAHMDRDHPPTEKVRIDFNPLNEIT